MTRRGSEYGRMLGYGGLTAVLYFLLFHFERDILALTSRGGWAFVVPIAIAFAVSLAHGTFTGLFWDVLGIRAKK